MLPTVSIDWTKISGSMAPSRVYPRVGAGTATQRSRRRPMSGLSPRGRGNRGRRAHRRAEEGSIPAWAGEPKSRRSPRDLRRVYPRVGGGTTRRTSAKIATRGLSPRGRGNLQDPECRASIDGSIPAWAGEPGTKGPAMPRARVYPRVGGGTSSPAGPPIAKPGLSPRGRGNRYYRRRPGRMPGSIPAWAGEPHVERMNLSPTQVHPRVGGGTAYCNAEWIGAGGLSPRGRGNPGQRHAEDGRPRLGSIPAWAGEPGDEDRARWGRSDHGSIPAWAGEPAIVYVDGPLGRVYPRVGGGTPGNPNARRAGQGLSPRGRGNHVRVFGPPEPLGSIPAWAGEPVEWARDVARGEVYPRVGGGTGWIGSDTTRRTGLSPRGRGNPRSSWCLLPAFRGLSPRGRGNQVCAPLSPGDIRSIPAWAGEPTGSALSGRTRTVYPRVGGGTP